VAQSITLERMLGMIHVTLSLDLKNATKQQRDAFDGALKDEAFVKLTGVDTVWVFAFPNEPTESAIVEASGVIQRFLKEVVEELKIEKITYVLQIGNSPPVGAEIEDIYGTHKARDFDPTVIAD
jgi:hypothetical protein